MRLLGADAHARLAAHDHGRRDDRVAGRRVHAAEVREVEAVEARLVDGGAVLTGGGVSLGIDMTLHLLERLCGADAAAETARVLEYSTAWAAIRCASAASGGAG